MTITMMDDRYGTNSRTVEIQWEDIIHMIDHPTEHAEKGHGAMIGGACYFITGEDGKKHRKNRNRCLVTIDIDRADFGGDILFDYFSDFCEGYSCNYGTYDSFSSRADARRCRVIIPLDRTVTPDEYNIIAKAIAMEITDAVNAYAEYDWHIEIDPCSVRSNQPMFLPAVSTQGTTYYAPDYIDDGESLHVDIYLDYIHDCLTDDAVNNAYMQMQGKEPKKPRERADDITIDYTDDPRERDSIVGSFCKAYTCDDVIGLFLTDVYREAGYNKYKYKPSHSPAGAFSKENGLFFYSHHQTDPVSRYGDVNAYTLVMIHKFGGDFDACRRWAEQLPDVQAEEKIRKKNYRKRVIA